MMHADRQQRPRLSGYDAELQRHNEVLRRACGVQVRDHILDIGCGTGQTTRQAARTARAGSALGVDVSAPAIERARELARAEGLRNVRRYGLHRRPRAGLLRPGCCRRARLGPRLHVHQPSAEEADPAAAARAVGRLREALTAHTSDDGVSFNSRAWIVTARRL